MKYKSKYYLKKNSILEENDNFSGSIDLINQKGGVDIRDLYKHVIINGVHTDPITGGLLDNESKHKIIDKFLNIGFL